MLEGDNIRMLCIHKSKKGGGDVMHGSVTPVRDYCPCALVILLILTCSMHSLSVLHLLLDSPLVQDFEGTFSRGPPLGLP